MSIALAVTIKELVQELYAPRTVIAMSILEMQEEMSITFILEYP